jgi:hypothetical protein
MAKGAGGNGMAPGMDYRAAAGAAQNAMGAMRKPAPAAGGMAPPNVVPGLGGRNWADSLQRGAAGLAGMPKPQAPPGGFAPGNLGDIPAGKNMPDIGAMRQRMQGLGAMGQAAPPELFNPTGMNRMNQNMNLDTGAINAPMPMNPYSPAGGAGGMNPVAQQLQRTGANPAYQNTVMNKLRPTMASNQNVQPLGMTNPRQASAGGNAAMQRVAQLRKSHQWGF